MPETPTIPQATDRSTRLTLPPFDGAAGAVYPVLKPSTDLRGRQTLPPFFMSPVRQGGPLPGTAQEPRAEQHVASLAPSEPEPAEPWAASSEPTSVLMAPAALGDAVDEPPVGFAPAEFAPDAELAPSDFAPVDTTEVDDGSSIYDVPQFERVYQPAAPERPSGTMAYGPVQDGHPPAEATTSWPVPETETDPLEDLERLALPVSRRASPESVVALLAAPAGSPADLHADLSKAGFAEASPSEPPQYAADDAHFVDPEYELQVPHDVPDAGDAVADPADPFAQFTQRRDGPAASLPPTLGADGTHEVELPSDDIADLFADPDFALPPALDPQHAKAPRRALRVTPVLDASRVATAPPIGSGRQTASRTTRRRPTPVLGSQAITPLATPVIRQTPMAGTLAALSARVPLGSRGASAVPTTVMSPTPIAVPALANMLGSRNVAQALEMVAARIRAGELVVAGDVPVGHDPVALASALAAALAALLGVRH